ncbi:MAG: succinate dehydrogenase cytochrome b subunit [Candidatus Latescibacterota bacterium]|jgi:succinate dehydrogenase / fumarate reductase cytochrome b subunit
MPWSVLSSSVGKKLGMALTGLILYGFLLGHLVGNLLLLRDDGGAAFNAYAAFLAGHPLLLPVEFFLLTVLVLHVYLAVTVTLENRRARPVRYQQLGRFGGGNAASSTMIYSGAVILIFLVLHLRAFKFGDRGDGTLYDLVVASFRQPLFAAWYVLCMAILGFHLWHAFQSACQTVGVGAHRVRVIGVLGCLLLSLGFGFLPVYLGFLSR